MVSKLPREAIKPKRSIIRIESAGVLNKGQAEQRAVAREVQKQRVRTIRRANKQAKAPRKVATSTRRDTAATKRMRKGGKAAGKTKAQRKPKYGTVEDIDDAGLGAQFFPSSRSSIRNALNEPVPLQRLMQAYPAMDMSLLEKLNKPDSEFNKKFTGPLRLPPPYTMENNVTTHRVGEGIVPFMKFVGEHAELPFNPKTFAAATMHVHGCTSLAFRSRSMVSAGTRCENESCLGAMRQLLLLTKWKVTCSFHNFRTQNNVASARVDFPINLEKLKLWTNAKHKYGTARYEGLFPGLTFRVKNSRIVILVFLAGNLVVTGARSPAQVSYILTWFYYKVLVRFRDDSLMQISSSAYRISQSIERINSYIHRVSQQNKKDSGAKGKKKVNVQTEAQQEAEREKFLRTVEEGLSDKTEAELEKQREEFLRSVEAAVKESLFDAIPEPVIETMPSVDVYSDAISTRTAQLQALAEQSEARYGSDFGLRRLMSNPVSVMWWDLRQKGQKAEEDPRWFSAACVDPVYNQLFDGQDEVPLVDENKFLCLQVLRIRHAVLTGNDEFDPRVMDMLLDCTRDMPMDWKFAQPFELKPHPELFCFHQNNKSRSAKWEECSIENAEKLLYLYDVLSLKNSPTPPGTWKEIMGDEPPLPTYHTSVWNRHDESDIRQRLAYNKMRLEEADRREKAANDQLCLTV